MRPGISHYCQKCLAANPLGQEFCTRCGTRLMIVVEPSASRFEAGPATLSTDEHLLERISAAENRVARLAERMERTLDLLLRYAQNAYFDRSLMRALVSLLTEDGVIETERLERMWNERCQKDTAEHEETVYRDEMRLRILAASKLSEKVEGLVNEGFRLLDENQISKGITQLSIASEYAPENAVLSLFCGEHYFREWSTKLARLFLGRAHAGMPNDLRVALLLGLICADEGEVDLAKQLLSDATAQGRPSFAAHYGLGWVFAAQKNSRRALSEFKRALSVRPSPEAHYALANLYYELNRDSLAERHLRKATQMDGEYHEAFYLLAQVYERTERKQLAREALRKSQRRRVKLLHLTNSVEPRLMASIGPRLAEALREDALRHCSVPIGVDQKKDQR
jgi:tetratricopeptide (TPR) repeat protein